MLAIKGSLLHGGIAVVILTIAMLISSAENAAVNAIVLPNWLIQSRPMIDTQPGMTFQGIQEGIVEDLQDNLDSTLSLAPSSLRKPSMTAPGSGWVWNTCGTGSEAIILEELNVTPDPPIPGKNLTVYAKGTLNADVEPGSFVDVVVKLGFIRFLSRRFDVCELAKENDAELQCPKKPGQYEITHTVELPREIPPAKFNVHVGGKTQDQVDLICNDLHIDFSHR